MHLQYEGNDTFKVLFDDGTEATLTGVETQELSETCDSYRDLDYTLYETQDNKKHIEKAVELALNLVGEMKGPIENIRRTKIKEELSDLIESIEEALDIDLYEGPSNA